MQSSIYEVRKDSVEATAMKTYVYGQPNLYGLFMAKAIELLCDNGQYIFITPRSWTSGKYFTKVRNFLQKELNIKEIDLFQVVMKFSGRESSSGDNDLIWRKRTDSK